MKSYLLFILLLAFSFSFVHAQSPISFGVSTALDYTTTPETVIYNRKGIGNQTSFRYGLKAMARLSKRLSFGLALESYSRKQNYDCVYLPTPNNPPQAFYYPIIDDPVYGCQFRNETHISLLEIPLVCKYDFITREKLNVFVEAGLGYQIITYRNTKLIDLQTGVVQAQEEQKSSFVDNRKTPRVSLGVTRNLSPKLTLEGSITYRTDAFAFEYNTVGLTTTLLYRL